MPVGLENLTAEFEVIQPAHWQGRVGALQGDRVTITGLDRHAAMGDLAELRPPGRAPIAAEIVALENGCAIALPDGPLDGVQVGDPVLLRGPISIAPDDNWLGRIIDAQGRPLDGQALLRGVESRALKGTPINPARRKPMGPRLETGLAVFNTMLPIARGQRVGLFAGSGVGKSTLLGKLVLGVPADVVVIAMIGERGRELREFVERVLGKSGMARTIIVASTSDQSAVMRRRGAWTAMAVAEHFRDQGKHVLFLADSVTRLAEAHREVALAGGEAAALRGFPPSSASLLTRFCERAGPGPEGAGDITAIFSVLVAGSDMEEPVADILRGVLDGHVVLDRAIAERGRFPAIDVGRSVSRSLPGVASARENEIIARARRVLSLYEKNEMMIQAGLYAAGADPQIDEAVAAWPQLDAFFAESELVDIANSFRRLERCLAAYPPGGSGGSGDSGGSESADVAAQGGAGRNGAAGSGPAAARTTVPAAGGTGQHGDPA